MYEMLIEFFIARPGRLNALGRTLFQLSAIILLVGLCGRIAIVGISAIQGIAGATPRDTSLAKLYPLAADLVGAGGFPGYFAGILGAVLGSALVQMGKAIDRAIG